MSGLRISQQSVFVQRLQQFQAFCVVQNTVQSDSIQPFKDVPIFAVLGLSIW